MELLNMAEGSYNLLLKKVGLSNEEVEWLAKIRLAHCEACVINDNPGLFEGRCTICNCGMESKTRAIKAKCPIGKW